jgi:large subunit ribosomal protein L13
MLPRTTQGRAQRTRLHVYAGADHPHSAQNPQPLEIQL